MESDLDLLDLIGAFDRLSVANRPLKLRLMLPAGMCDNVLLPQRLVGHEAVCGGFEYHVLCVADSAMLPLKDFIGVPAELQIVTDEGRLRSICGLVAEASSGESDGALATYQLAVTDALALLERRTNTRVFRDMNELEIVTLLVGEWRERMGPLGSAFDIECNGVGRQHPQRAFTMQHNESDAAFIRRLLKRRGIAWYFRPGHANRGLPSNLLQSAMPAHTLVLFDDSMRLPESAAGEVRYHRDNPTEERDTVTGWCAVRTLQASTATRHSWDYRNPAGRDFMASANTFQADQGAFGNHLAARLDAYFVDAPHVAADANDFAGMAEAQAARQLYDSKTFRGEGCVRALAAGEWFTLSEHPEIDTHDVEQRRFVVTSQHVAASNNLPKEIAPRIERLFSGSGWDDGRYAAFHHPSGEVLRFRTRFTCVRRGVRIVPSFDPRVDLPRPQLQSAIVVGPLMDEVACDEYGRVKIRFPATRTEDHAHAAGMGTSDADGDSAWVRVASNWAGNGPGDVAQCGTLALPRVGTEVLVDFLGGDPDKPIIVGQLYNGTALPPALSRAGGLPGNRHLSGIRSREVGGMRGNQLRLDDTPGQISVQLASEHGASELNLGYLTEGRRDGLGEPRGEGAELCSDHAVAIRGGRGVLLTASPGQEDVPQLKRDTLAGAVRSLASLTCDLNNHARSHMAESAPAAALDRLTEHVEDWDQGSNVDASGEGAGGQPIVAAHGDAGLLLTSQKGVVLGSEIQVEVASVGDVQLSAGRGLFARAARALELFAVKLGIKLIAGAGNVEVSAHNGDIVITALKHIRLVAAEGISLDAPAVKIVAQGVQADYGGGKITQQSSGEHTIRSSCFDQLDAGDGEPEELDLPATDVQHDQQVQLLDLITRAVLPNRRYRIRVEDGTEIEGVSDANGLTERFDTKLAFANYTIEVID
ncbi:type VI secretion system Vgr family protein [Pseudoduganella ginsengisoli]|uniref:Type VI secretion system tip protein VgrG n=1 Tax=Pseudoduganella ginsengisoli TaxID=1462440 RepID=A0A6L6PY18_9BURK|nr:type VI secretion system Vgr family protein [Pseudoduganella ginsengisoli]MTW02021.1 type VI secretion system tip protein VgrG [Pseudoduganella ginsengisoli]